MYNFFVENSNKKDSRFFIYGDDYNHIKNVLRMGIGEAFLVSCEGTTHLCRLAEITSDTVIAEIECENYQSTNLKVNLHLFQGLPKSDKLELIIQKAVELGACSVTPVAMKRSIVKLDEKKKKSKQQRWQAIAESAAKQSKRSFVPKVYDVLSYNQFIKKACELDLLLVPYECADKMTATRNALSKIKSGMNIGIIIGPEGGFEPTEIDAAKKAGGEIISLGERILRTETAAITALAMCMLYSEMELD